MAALPPASSDERSPVVVEDPWSGRGAHILVADDGDAALPASHDAGPIRSRERCNLVELELERLEVLPRQGGHADQIGCHDRDRCRQTERGDDAPPHNPSRSRRFPTRLP